jgi:heme/copper-type cytochrome/quinol oxidase subunit 3
MPANVVVIRVPLKDKIISWALVAMSYAFTFITPMVAAYYLLAYETMEQSGRGGLLYFMIVGIFGSMLVFNAIRLLNKQKANSLKTIFKTGVKLAFLFLVIRMVEYIDFNIDKLVDVLYITIGGFGAGAIVEWIAVHFYTDYIREVGVF